MCPHGYHHNGFMATPALGTQEVSLHIVWTVIYVYINEMPYLTTAMVYYPICDDWKLPC